MCAGMRVSKLVDRACVGDVLHREKWRGAGSVIVRPRFVHRSDIRMLQATEHARFVSSCRSASRERASIEVGRIFRATSRLGSSCSAKTPRPCRRGRAGCEWCNDRCGGRSTSPRRRSNLPARPARALRAIPGSRPIARANRAATELQAAMPDRWRTCAQRVMHVHLPAHPRAARSTCIAR